MEEDKQLGIKLVFVAPSWLGLFTAIYSFFYWSDFISKILCGHLSFLCCLPTLLEFSPMFHEYILAGYAPIVDVIQMRIGVLLYIGLLVSIVGVGILGSITAAISFIAAFALLICEFKHQLASKLGFAVDVPNLEVI